MKPVTQKAFERDAFKNRIIPAIFDHLCSEISWFNLFIHLQQKTYPTEGKAAFTPVATGSKK